MVRRTGAELVAEVHAASAEARSALAAGELEAAVAAATHAFRAARAQRSHQLISDAWIGLVEVLAVDPDDELTKAYREHVEGAYYWGESMPEEIQVWFFLALEPHLETLGLHKLAGRARARREAATAWVTRGGVNVMTTLHEYHLADLAEGRRIDRRALALEHMAAFYAQELFDPEALMLDEAAEAWRAAHRPDRADNICEVANAFRSR